VQTIRFDDFELDLDTQRLRLRGETVPLERRPFELLVLLIKAEGRVVTREDIIAKLWPANVIIDFDSGINTLVRKVRNALGDSSEEPRYIETVAGRGYRFMAALADTAVATTAINAPRRRGMALGLAATFAAIIVVALIALWPEDTPSHTRIAVLPFENLTGDAALDYMAAGIAEETSIALANIDLPNLSIIGVVSARALAGPDISLPEYGRDLGVDFFVVSSLRVEANRMRVNSRLLRVADSEQLWSASFDRELTNALGLQRELSIAIAEQIRQQLSPEVAAAIDRRQTQNPEAYELYLKGRYEWTQFQPGSVDAALDYYEQAVTKDPTYGLAWAGMAHALITSVVTEDADREAILPASQYALQNALEFGANLSETQLALASFRGFIEHDQVAAAAAAREAIALDPNNAMAHMFLGLVLAEQHEFVESRAMLRRARELDPLFPLIFANSANAAMAAGELQDAVEFATQAIAINPEFWVGYLHLGNAQRMLGNYQAAVDAFADAEKYSGNRSIDALASRAAVLARMGREDEARAILEQLLARAVERYVPPHHIAIVYAALGETDAAFEWLDRAVTSGRFGCNGLRNEDQLQSLRDDARFADLLGRCDTAITTE